MVNPNETTTRGVRQWAGPGLLTLIYITLAAWTWRKWPDLLIDFGRELYVPWQLAQGKVLYRDIAHFIGPFSQSFNAAMFQIFGVSFTTLIFANLAILAAMLGLIYRSLTRACDHLTATLAGLVFLVMFAFAHYWSIGSMNLVSPYSHEVLHGIALATAMLSCLNAHLRSNRPGWVIGAGLCFGLIFLTKAEIWAASLLAVSTWLGLSLFSAPPRKKASGKAALLFAAMTFVPLAGCFSYFLIHLPLREAWRATHGAFSFVFDPAVFQDYFYRAGMGLDDLPKNLLLLLKMSLWIAGWISLAAGLDWVGQRTTGNRPWVLIPVALFVFGVALFNSARIPWIELPRALPLTTLLALLVLSVKWYQHRLQPECAARYSTLLMWSTLALALLAKMLFKVRLYHYGFYLAMPAALMLVVTLVGLIPRQLQARPGGGRLFRALMLALLAAALIFHARQSQRFYAYKNWRIGTGGDLILGYGPEIHPRDYLLAAALHWIERETPPGATLVVMPEGGMLNYLSRRPNPMPYFNFMPVEINVYGESQILAALRKSQPDYVILVHSAGPEVYGVGYFGTDPRYGKMLVGWVDQHYEPVKLFGAEPNRPEGRFGIKILKRRD